MNKLSIIIPVYNCSQTLPYCIESLLSQTYSNYEILLIDDGSTDSSFQICQSYSQSYSCIHTHQIPHSGVSAARNYGLLQAVGDYITFADSDDYVEPDIYETMINSIISQNTKLCICGYYTEKSAASTPIIGNYQKILSSRDVLTLMFTEDIIGGFVWNKLYARELLAHEQFDTSISICEDLVFNTKLLLSLSQNISYVDKPLYHYKISDASATNTKRYFVSPPKGGTAEFMYAPAFRILRDFAHTPVLFHQITKKYADILQYSMYCLLTSPRYDYAQISKLKKVMQQELTNIWNNPELSRHSKLHYLILCVCPIIYGKIFLSHHP